MMALPADKSLPIGKSRRMSGLGGTPPYDGESPKTLWSVFDQMPIGILTTDRACTIVAINASACASFKTSFDKAVGRHVGAYLPQFDESRTSAAAHEILHAVDDYMDGRREDGVSVPCEVALSEVETGTGSALVWTLRDVSVRAEMERQKKALEKELEQAHRLESLGTLAGGIAHELNTPIQFVSDNMRFLGDAFAEVQRALAQYALITPPAENERIVRENDLAFLLEEAPNAVTQSLEGLERAADIVLAVKRFSHPSGDIKEDNDLNQIISTTATVSKNQWKYIADLELDLDQNLPLVKSNAGELNQVLINLIVNAAHAIEDRNDKDHKGKISISTRMVGQAIACSVSDSGVGIPARDRDKIFDLFFTTKAPGRGTGQGLALVHKIITSHGGRITMNSEVGKGTRFIFILPIDVSASKISVPNVGALRASTGPIT